SHRAPTTMPKLAVTLDTSPETLRSRAPAASGAPRPPPTPRSRWSPPTPAEPTPLSPVTRLRRTISNAVSPTRILTRNRQSLQPPQPIPLQTIITDVSNSASRLLPNPNITPLDRFRHAVFKVMQMNKLKRAMISMHDPGIDAGNPATSKVLLNVRHEDCVIDVLDYGIAHAKSTRLTNSDLGAFLAQPYRSTAKHVRWINVSGTSWDVISQLARQYGERKAYRKRSSSLLIVSSRSDLHPLAIEDIYSGEKIARSKVDYYPQHIFLRLLCHLPRRQGKNSRRDIFISPGLHGREGTFTSDVMDVLSDDSDDEQCRRPHLKAVKTLARLYGLFDPIERRLKKSKSTLRMRPDASMLLHALIDHVVHRSMDLIDDFHEQVLEFEKDILIRPSKISVMRDLHIASGDIKLAQATLRPFKHIVRILIKQDANKCIALTEDQSYARRNKDQVQGYMSREAKVYLTSTMDDVDHILMSLKSHAAKTERLLRYAFEMTSNSTRDASKAWTVTFVSFQPLIVLVMYFGMNFNGMLSVQAHTERFFWVICIPVMVAVFTFIVWQTRPWRYFQN
ncbi:hypothetical protein FRC01_008717, partial [Tulasnella sp. 417]